MARYGGCYNAYGGVCSRGYIGSGVSRAEGLRYPVHPSGLSDNGFLAKLSHCGVSVVEQLGRSEE